MFYNVYAYTCTNLKNIDEFFVHGSYSRSNKHVFAIVFYFNLGL